MHQQTQLNSDVGCQGALRPDNNSIIPLLRCCIRSDGGVVPGVPCSGEICFLLIWLGPPSPLELQANHKLVRTLAHSRLGNVLCCWFTVYGTVSKSRKYRGRCNNLKQAT